VVGYGGILPLMGGDGLEYKTKVMKTKIIKMKIMKTGMIETKLIKTKMVDENNS
jgi:hypothetical protein